MKDYYEILEVSRNASKNVINKVFKMHMKANHPDLFTGEEKIKAEEKSKEFTEAYNILSDENERAKYDEQLKAQEQNTYTPEIQSIIEENEYLKQVLNKKDEIINRLTNTNYNYYNSYSPLEENIYRENYSGFNGFTPPQSNPYEGMSLEELQKLKREQTKLYYKEKFKDIIIKIIVLLFLLFVFFISVSISLKDLSKVLK